jgi:hypothetical protein
MFTVLVNAFLNLGSSNAVSIVDLLSHWAGTHEGIPKLHFVFAILVTDTSNEKDFAINTIFNVAIYMRLVGEAIEVFLASGGLFYDFIVEFNLHFL